MTAAEAAHRLLAAMERGEAVVEVVVTSSSLGEPPIGARMLIYADRVEGSLADPDLDRLVSAIAVDQLGNRSAVSGCVELPDGAVSVYLGIHRPADPLVILGAGHIARPLCTIGAMLGFTVTVLDDRPDFATSERFPEAERVVRVTGNEPFGGIELSGRTRLVLVTRGHKFDFEALRLALRLPDPPGYIGMVGSQRRVRATLEQLVREGVPSARLSSVHAPIGLDIGAETPEEIAVAIAAELVKFRRGGTGDSLRDRSRVVDRWIRKSE
ncbi:XdhC/CoxI family protein [soil metagenome]